jgi:hypothetical protein
VTATRCIGQGDGGDSACWRALAAAWRGVARQPLPVRLLRMRSRSPVLTRSIRLGGLGKVTVAEAIVVGVMAGLVTLVWRYVL